MSERNTTRQEKDRPWLFRTYSGHSSASASNALYKKNLEKGQTGLSVAFDLPTQTGYDSDHILAKGEVGKVGVPICHLGDMMDLFDGIPLEKMNTSMTINATAPWILSLYIVTAQRQGAEIKNLKGTTQNDIIKEYLSRGTYAFPPEPSLRLSTDIISYTYQNMPGWNPINICPYHLQEAGATPVQELSYGLANAIAILDLVKEKNIVSKEDFEKVVGRISFFLDSGIRFIEELCKTKAFTRMWKEICETRYGVKDSKFSRFRYGVQVNSLGLTEQQPENNIIRIILETLGVTLSKEARARAVQLPAWNESLGLPRPWDQQWSLRIQQILAYETDLLEYKDIFDGSRVVEEKVSELISAAKEEIKKIESLGGIVSAIENGYIKSQLVKSNTLRVREIEENIRKVIGVNCYQETEESPLAQGVNIVKIDENTQRQQIEKLNQFRKDRNQEDVNAALNHLKESLVSNENIMKASLRCAESGVTTGEWAEVLRKEFGSYNAPTGIQGVEITSDKSELLNLRKKLQEKEKQIGQKLRFLVAKPGLDGHSNGAEQIAVQARNAGFEVVYQGIRQTPEEIVNIAEQEDVHVIGMSILSGSHLELSSEILKKLEAKGLKNLPVVLGGIIPKEDADQLTKMGIKKVYTPQDFEIYKILDEIIDFIEANV